MPEGSSGSLVAAVGGGEAVCRGWGMADRERRTAAGCDTVYDVMSMTKQFTAVAVLTLQMRHELRTSDPISHHLRGVPADKQAITIHHLLTHTAGLVDTLGGDDERVSRAALVAAALDSDLRTEPGAAYHYSNVGYSLLAAIIQLVSGQGYEEYLAEHLFEPASMTRTGYVLPDWDRSQLAVEYDAAGVAQGRPTDHPWASEGPYWTRRPRPSSSSLGCARNPVATRGTPTGGSPRTSTVSTCSGTTGATGGRTASCGGSRSGTRWCSG